MPKVAMSSWTFHEELGGRWNELHPNREKVIPANLVNEASLDLLSLPREVASHGIKAIDICHFHLPSIEAAFLEELKESLVEAEVELVHEELLEVRLLLDFGLLLYRFPF